MRSLTRLLSKLWAKPQVQTPQVFCRQLARERDGVLRHYEGGLELLKFSARWTLTLRRIRVSENSVWAESESDRAIVAAIYRAEQRKADLKVWRTLLDKPYTHWVSFSFTTFSSNATHTLINRPVSFALVGFNSDALAGATVDALAKFLKEQTDRMFLLRHDQYAQMFWLQFLQSYLKMRDRY